jgi:protease I
MAQQLNSRRIAFVVANQGVEQVELISPWEAVEAAGGTPVLVAPQKGEVHCVHADTNPAASFDADVTTAEARPDDFDGVVLPGGVANPDKLRLDDEAVSFVRAFAEAGKPIAAICHGPWTLVEADLVRGKTLTSWPSLRTDIRNAGGDWRDVEVFTCPANGWSLVTSRKPDDLDAFDEAAVAAFAASAA